MSPGEERTYDIFELLKKLKRLVEQLGFEGISDEELERIIKSIDALPESQEKLTIDKVSIKSFRSKAKKEKNNRKKSRPVHELKKWERESLTKASKGASEAITTGTSEIPYIGPAVSKVVDATMKKAIPNLIQITQDLTSGKLLKRNIRDWRLPITTLKFMGKSATDIAYKEWTKKNAKRIIGADPAKIVGFNPLSKSGKKIIATLKKAFMDETGVKL